MNGTGICDNKVKVKRTVPGNITHHEVKPSLSTPNNVLRTLKNRNKSAKNVSNFPSQVRHEEREALLHRTHNFETISILEDKFAPSHGNKGANQFHWWTWTVRIRTVAKVPIQVNLLDSFRVPIYQKIAKIFAIP